MGVRGGLVEDSEGRTAALVAPARTVRLRDEDSPEGAPTTRRAVLDALGVRSPIVVTVPCYGVHKAANTRLMEAADVPEKVVQFRVLLACETRPRYAN